MSAIDLLERHLNQSRPLPKLCLQCTSFTLNERICDRPECQRAEAEREAAK